MSATLWTQMADHEFEIERESTRMEVSPGDRDSTGATIRGCLGRSPQNQSDAQTNTLGMSRSGDELAATHTLHAQLRDTDPVPDRGDGLRLVRVRKSSGVWVELAHQPRYQILKVWSLPGMTTIRYDLVRLTS